MATPDLTTKRGEARLTLAAHALQGLLASRAFSNDTKKRVCDNAIAYADMMLRRLAEIPPDAQEITEQRSKRPRIGDNVDWNEINKIADAK